MAYAEERRSPEAPRAVAAGVHGRRVDAIAADLGREWTHTAGILESLAQTHAALGNDEIADHLRSRAPRARLEGERAMWFALRWRPAPGAREQF